MRLPGTGGSSIFAAARRCATGVVWCRVDSEHSGASGVGVGVVGVVGVDAAMLSSRQMPICHKGPRFDSPSPAFGLGIVRGREE